MIKKMWNYQQEAFEQTMTHLRANTTALVVMASGLGKTVVAAFLAKEFLSQGRILFLCHEAEILKQARRIFRQVLGSEVTLGIFYGEEKNCEEVDVLFGTFQTFRAWREAFLAEEFNLIIVDESHHAEAITYRPVLDYFQPRKMLGITATPDRTDEKDIRDIFGEPVVNVDLFTAIHKNWLPFVEYHILTDGLNRRKLHELLTAAKEGDRKIGVKQVNETVFIKKRDDEIAKIIRSYGEKQIVIFCESILHAENFSHFLPDTQTYHSEIPSRLNTRTLQRFRDGELRYILAVDKLNEGVDMPDAEVVVFLRSTDSRTVFLQQLGRCLRKKAGKKKVTVLDFVANCERIFAIKSLVDESANEGYGEDTDILKISGQGFLFQFADELRDILEIARYFNRDFYPTWEEASQAAQGLGVKSERDYKVTYKKDPRLSSNPNAAYPDVWKQNGGWSGFLGREIVDRKERPFREQGFYPTWEEASKAAQSLGIKTSFGYCSGSYKKDHRLPSEPHIYYSKVWKKNGGWRGFLSGKCLVKVGVYSTWEEASRAVRNLGVTRGMDYINGAYKRDGMLPAAPYRVYRNVWIKNGGWAGYLGVDPSTHRKVYKHPFKKRENNFYLNWEEASQAAQDLGIASSMDYIRGKYKLDPRLPSEPRHVYEKVWKQNGGWPGFLGREIVDRKERPSKEQGFYLTWEESSQAAQKLGISSALEYWIKHKIDLRLYSNPAHAFSDVWKQNGGWPGFLGKKR